MDPSAFGAAVFNYDCGLIQERGGFVKGEPDCRAVILSELISERPNPGVLQFIHEADEDRLFLSALAWAEIRRGIALLPESRKRDRLTEWLENDLRDRFANRLLSVSVEIADR